MKDNKIIDNLYVQLSKHVEEKFALLALVLGCKKHPAYRYHKKNRTNCKKCKFLYEIRLKYIKEM